MQVNSNLKITFGDHLRVARVAIANATGLCTGPLHGLEQLEYAEHARQELRRFFDANRFSLPRDLSDVTTNLIRLLTEGLDNMRRAASAQAEEHRERGTLPERELYEVNKEHAALSQAGLLGKLPEAIKLIEHIDKILSNADTESRLIEPSSSHL